PPRAPLWRPPAAGAHQGSGWDGRARRHPLPGANAMTEPIRVLVEDDEEPARAALQQMLAEDPEVRVVGCCSDGKKALAELKALEPEVMFLDVRMPGLDGFQVVQAAGPRPPRVIFVTAHAGHALEAFDAEAVDYV